MRGRTRLAIGLGLLLASGAAAADPISIVVALSGVVGSTAATIIANVLVFAATYGTALLTIGSFAYSGYQRRKQAARMREAALAASLKDRLVMATMTDGPRSRIYGEARNVDGVIWKGVHGPNDEIYTLVVSVAGHEVEAIGDVYFGDQKLTLDGSGYVQDAPYKDPNAKISSGVSVTLDGSGAGTTTLPHLPISGSVTAVQGTGPGTMGSLTVSVNYSTGAVTLSGGTGAGLARVYYQYASNVSHARVRKFLGGPSQNLYPTLSAEIPGFTADDRFAGDAVLVIDLTYSQDAFPGGIQPASAVVKGAKVYDPRTGTTAYTENPALHSRDWALYEHGGGLTVDQIDDASFIAAANACDVSHTWHFPGITLLHITIPEVTVTDTLYRCGIVCKLEGSPMVWMDEIVESMAGRHGWSGGKLRVVAGAWRAPVAHITESWLNGTGDIDIVPEPAIADAINTYRATIADRNDGFTVQPVAPVVAAAYVTADGMELVREVDLQGVVTTYHAQHIGGVVMRESRQGLTVTLPCKLHAFALELFDVVEVTIEEFGWDAKTFEVLGWSWSPLGGIDLQLKETNAEIYDPDADFANLGNSDNTALPDASAKPALTGMAITSGTAALTDGSILTRTRVVWDAATSAAVLTGGKVEVQFTEGVGAIPTGDWPGWIEDGSATEAVIPGLRVGVFYLFRARFVTTLVRGPWCTQKGHYISAVPLVDTAGLADNAATEDPITTTQATQTATVPSGGGTVNMLSCETLYVNDTGGEVTVEVQASWSCTAVGAGPGSSAVSSYINVFVADASSTFVYTVGEFNPESPVDPVTTGQTVRWTASRTLTAVLPAGYELSGSINNALVGSGNNGGSTVTLRDGVLRMTPIKR